MRKSTLLRRILALVLCAAFISLTLPSLAGAGGCDDPGGVGTCNTKPHGGHLIHPPGPAPTSHVPATALPSNAKQGLPSWLAWLLTIVSSTLR